MDTKREDMDKYRGSLAWRAQDSGDVYQNKAFSGWLADLLETATIAVVTAVE